jgi:hypothetical protein
MIDLFFTTLRKMMLAIVMVIFVFTITYVPQPQTNGGYSNVEVAHAGGITLDPINLIQNTLTAIQVAATYVIQNWIYIKENVLDGIVWSIAKQIVSNMVSSIVDWINSGFEGSPAFVQDLDNFLLRAADEAVGTYINELGGLGSFVCSPFRLDVQIAVAIQYDLEREDREVSCTLTDVIDNFEDFIDGDFREGGWAGWFDLVAEPTSLPYGSILAAQTQARFRAVNAEGEELSFLNFGGGFLSWENCDTFTNPDGSTGENCYVATPGDVIANSINKSLGAGQDQLVAADEFNEIISALIGQLAQTAITGVSGLLGAGGSSGSYTPYSRGRFIDDLADGVINGEGTGGGSGGYSGFDPGTDPGTESGRDYIANALTTQSNVLTETDQYIQDLTDFINNPLNDEVDIALARTALSQAQGLQDQVAENIEAATPILDEYDALETEYETASPERQAQIRAEQSDLIQQFSSLSLTTQREIDIYTGNWDQILANNVEPPVYCFEDPTDPDCIEFEIDDYR